MGNKDAIIDLDTLDLSQVVADLDEIRRYNPQRFEMEQLSGIVYENPESHICVGFKDVGRDEFWIRGHMPGMPLMPGVVMCEAAAQLSSYFAVKYDMLGSGFVVGLGGLEEVRIRESVYPGDRMYVVCQLVRAPPRQNYHLPVRGICQEQDRRGGNHQGDSPTRFPRCSALVISSPPCGVIRLAKGNVGYDGT